MKFEWQEIYNNSEIKSSPYFEATYRAKVHGGWLVKHETFCDYQYEDKVFDETNLRRFIHDEGYQDIKNVITFISDPNHEWTID
jgi:hypothetical protein